MLFKRRKLKRIGSKIQNRLLARTLYRISKNYKVMYNGYIAKQMVKSLKKMKGPQTLNDFKTYKTRKLALIKLPLIGRYTLLTLSNRTGGPLLAYILSAVKGKLFIYKFIY